MVHGATSISSVQLECQIDGTAASECIDAAYAILVHGYLAPSAFVSSDSAEFVC